MPKGYIDAELEVTILSCLRLIDRVSAVADTLAVEWNAQRLRPGDRRFRPELPMRQHPSGPDHQGSPTFADGSVEPGYLS
jgi:hypothetical protein